MFITLETNYAIRIIAYLVQNTGLTSAPKISEETAVPLRFAKNILQKLAGSGIIISYKGIYGGYKLGMQPDDISLYDVYKAIQGPIVLNRCLNNGISKTCNADEKCPFHDIFLKISQDIENRLCKLRFSTIIPGSGNDQQFQIIHMQDEADEAMI